MKVLKQLFRYFSWLILCLILGIIYMRLLLGEIPNEDSYNGFGFFLKLFYQYGLVYVGLIIGTIIALIFILLDYFVLRKRLSNNWNSLLIRISIVLLIIIIVGAFHYFFEKIIGII